ncbi:SRPBCC family protein [Asanoa iriomotensis]|uniref:Activator of Hsp90 ATPase homologue 1/2-like C-terminal domain-containing protein n=1 Tax=Asanoa iriomotensis TaxID=234613 RepID=A0ABQ4BYS9_9ACTN|nr:SRPBCC family protein [Asanoa iriomotensis]GIF55686.1 hypothetical protein Air01nite_17810 [Asanoa iriomotensis]
MSLTPTGQLFGNDLVLTRTFRAPAADVWASLTDTDRTARWFGPWKGDAAPGRTIEVQMVHEDGQPWMEMTIDACEPQRRLALSAVDEQGSWLLDMVLTESGGVTELRFTQHLADTAAVGDLGPGWEFYLDALVAAREDRPAPRFEDYYPAMKDHFDAQR